MYKAIIRITLFTLVAAAAYKDFNAWKLPALAAKVPDILLSLQVNREREVSLLPGTPLVFTVFMSGSKTDPPLRIGGSGDPWYVYLRLESADGKKQIPFTWSLLGKPHALPRLGSSDDLGNAELYAGDEAILEKERNLYTAELGVAPEETAKIPEGRYTIRAVLEVPSGAQGKWSGRAVSNPVVVSLGKRVKETTPEDDPELSRLIESIDFYLRAERFEDAYRLALELKERQPKKVQSYILLGDALNGLKRDREALEAYMKALYIIATKGKQYEPPTYLIMRMDEVKQRLEER
jgi:tetratricopeptide (TPR) repeat protein